MKNTGRSVKQERVVIAAGLLPREHHFSKELIGEMKSLCETAGTKVVGEITQRLSKPHSAHFIGKGKTGELKELIAGS